MEAATIHRELQEASQDAKVIFRKLREDCDLEDVVNAELLAKCAEAALRPESDDAGEGEEGNERLAKECANLSLRKSVARDQFYCRALCVLARVELKEGDVLFGQECIEQVKKALKRIEEIVDICMIETKRPSYSFMMRNAAILGWRTARTQMRSPLWVEIRPFLARVNDGLLNVAPEEHELRARYGIALIHAFMDEKNPAQAYSEAQKLSSFIQGSGPELDDLKIELDALKLHLGGPNSAANAKSALQQGNLVPLVQCLRSKLLPDPIAKELIEIAKDSKNIGQRILLGIQAVRLGNTDFAKECLEACSSDSTVLKAQDALNIDILRAEVLVSTLDVTGMDVHQQLALRVKAIKTLEGALQAAARLSCACFEEISISVWNISLPLLQGHLRKHVHRAFQLAADGLEKVDSSMLNLRALLHTELSKCEAAEDFLTKAELHIKKVARIESLLDPRKGQSTELTEKLKPLSTKLRLKTNVFAEPGTKLESIILMIEQARDAKEAQMKMSLLKKSIQKLEELENIEECMELWNEVAEIAWKEKFKHLTLHATEAVFQATLGDEDDFEKWRRRARMHFISAELHAHLAMESNLHEMAPKVANLDLRSCGLRIPSINLSNDDGDDECRDENHSSNNITDPDQMIDWPVWEDALCEDRLEKLKNEVTKHLLEALRIGARIKEPWLIENGATYLWNLHVHVFTGPLQRFYFVSESLQAALHEAVELLQDLEELERNDSLFCAVTNACAISLEHTELPNNLKAAAEMCEFACQKCDVGFLRDLLATWQRIQRKRKVNSVLPEECLRNLFSVVELLRLSDELVPLTEKAKLVKKTKEELTEDVKMLLADQSSSEFGLALESWSRFGLSAIRLNNSTADECADEILSALPSRFLKRGSIIELNPIKPKRGQIVKENWRWYSIASCLKGRVSAIRAKNPSTDTLLQTILRQQSMKHFCIAAEYGVNASMAKLVLDAAQEMWNVLIRLRTTVATRSTIFQPLKAILHYLEEVKEKTNLKLRADMYSALFECFQDREDWEGGFDAVREAFNRIPLEHQQGLWEARVVFASRLGKDVAAGLHRMKEGTKELKAKAWVTLARFSRNKMDQFHAYREAIKLLDDSFLKTSYLIDFSEWLHSNDSSSSEAVLQCLLQAADIILDFKAAIEERERAIAEASAARGGSPGSQSSKMTSRTKRTSRTAMTRSSLGKKSKISGQPNGAPEDIRLNEMLKLVQIFTMASFVAHGAKIQRDTALIAYQYLIEAWERFGSAHLMEEDQGKTLVEKCIDRVGMKISPKFPVQRPLQVCQYLGELGNILERFGFAHCAIPCNATIAVIANQQLAHKSIEKLAKLRIADALRALNMIEKAKSLLSTIDTRIDPEELVAFGNDVEQIFHQRQLQQTNSGSESRRTQPPKLPREAVDELNIRSTWVRIAETLLHLDRFFEAKVYLCEAAKHADAFDDGCLAGKIFRLQCEIALQEGFPAKALELGVIALEKLRVEPGTSRREWSKSLIAVADALVASKRPTDASVVLKEGLNTMSLAFDPETQEMKCEMRLRLAKIVDFSSKAFVENLAQAENMLPSIENFLHGKLTLSQSKLWLEKYSQLNDVQAFQNCCRTGQRSVKMLETIAHDALMSLKGLFGNDEACVLPVCVLLAEGHVLLGNVVLLHQSRVQGLREEENKNEEALLHSENPVERWLAETAPPPELTYREFATPGRHLAWMHFSNASSCFGSMCMDLPRNLLAGLGSLLLVNDKTDGVETETNLLKLADEAIENHQQLEIAKLLCLELCLLMRNRISLLKFLQIDAMISSGFGESSNEPEEIAAIAAIVPERSLLLTSIGEEEVQVLSLNHEQVQNFLRSVEENSDKVRTNFDQISFNKR